jgi:hypothetical protein
VVCNHQSRTIDSTIGGIVVVDGRLCGLTTAHGIVNHILNHERGSRLEEEQDEQEDEGEKGEDTEGSSEYESDDTSSGGSQYSVQEKTRLLAARSERDGFQDNKKPQDSIRLELPKVLRYLDRGTAVGDYSLTLRSPATNQADFLLIDLEPAGPAAQRNVMHKQGGPLSIRDHVPAYDLVQGEVDIITGNNGYPVKGYLLRGDTSLILRGNLIRTRKIQVEHPGGKSSSIEIVWHWLKPQYSCGNFRRMGGQERETLRDYLCSIRDESIPAHDFCRECFPGNPGYDTWTRCPSGNRRR